MMPVTIGGVNPAPKPTPPNTQPFALPRSVEGNQAAMNWLADGYATASPRPNTNRTTISIQSAPAIVGGTRVVATLKTPHQTIPSVSVRRGPSFPAIQPAGI